ncbi:type II secretion system protein GspL [Neisseriaceae bacterium JH1-16]|nr:type II secretion system protein GspL [Neisseriaceae bacterium JH1-16]
MTILRLLLAPGWPDSAANLPWALLDAHGARRDSGDCAPSGWPAATELELVLPAGRTLFTAVKLPDGQRDPTPQLIGFALEDQLANDPSANLYLAGKLLGDGRRQVILTEAAPVRRAVAMLRQLGRVPDRIVPEEALLPLPAAGWALAALASGWLARLPQAPCWLPAGSEAALLPTLAAEVDGPLTLHGEAETLAEWLPVHEAVRLAPFDWRHGLADGSADFATGELAARHFSRRWAPLARKLGLVAGVLIAAQLTLLLGELGWSAWQKSRLTERSKTLSTAWLNSPALPGMATLPVTRAVDKLRLARGLPARDDGLALMGALARVAGTELTVQRLNYENGRLELSVAALPPASLPRWRAQLAERRIALTQQRGENGSQQLIVTREP